MERIMVTTYPFGDPIQKPRELLKDFKVFYNDVGRKYSRKELEERLVNYDPTIIIAGTEKYDSNTLDLCPNLRMISRVGIGLDSLDLDECEKRGIVVTYTPDAPSNAVAELTVGQTLNALRRIKYVSNELHEGNWERHIGRELSQCNIGVIGYGRIGKKVSKKYEGFEPNKILINDTDPAAVKDLDKGVFATKDAILSESDIITIHIPLNKENEYFIGKNELDTMKPNAILINMSRGGILDEKALYQWLHKNPSAAAIIDTFEDEPYLGDLRELPNAYLTPHLGSCTRKSRLEMEVGSVEEVLRFLNSEDLKEQVV